MKFDPNAKSETKLYRIWRGMLLRTSSNCSPHFKNYKARGITICERWLKFENFKADMGEPPDALSIDRINNDGNYEPGNCRWATRSQQMKNRRYIRPITFQGRTMLLTEWAAEAGIKVSTLSMRIDAYKWPLEKALFGGRYSRAF